MPAFRFSIALLAILAFDNIVCGLDVSSQINFDSQEETKTADNSQLKSNANLDEENNRIPAPPQTSKTSALRPNLATGFLRTGEQKKRRSYLARGESATQPTIINNIKILVNGNETESTLRSCTNGICDVSASSRVDEAGNVVTDVHLVIVTKLNANPGVADIPVYDGTRGAEDVYERPPDFNLLNQPPARPHFYYNIPQIQTRQQDPAEPWYRDRSVFQRPRPATWYYHRVGEREGNRFFTPRQWVPSKPVVDDKIEPPLSKTQGSSE